MSAGGGAMQAVGGPFGRKAGQTSKKKNKDFNEKVRLWGEGR